MTFTTNTSTQFQNMSGMGMMSNGVLVMVDAMLQADGSIQAQKLNSYRKQQHDGYESSAIPPHPATQIRMVTTTALDSR